ncbi:hypothetical protein [Actinocorallia longicatena]|uniref:PknH-like protein n=1 Tax=Actinocorallia longicatena TaxID=111803 RepID=A0ABP6QFQ7_9ACTN
MREIDTLFGELRREVVPNVTGPAPGEIIGRARARRARRRIAAGTAAVVVAAGLFAVQADRRGHDPVLTPTPAPTPAPHLLKVADLLFAGAAADGDEQRWTAQDDSLDPPAIATCLNGPVAGEDPFGDVIEGAEQRLSTSYNGNKEIGNELTHTSFSEQLIVFTDPAAAQRIMRRLEQVVDDCEGADVKRWPIGDEAISSVYAFPGTPPQRTQGVAFRQGRVIAIYGDHRNDGRRLKTLGDHLDNAQTMAARLRAWGF